ncbi:SUMO-activating enzyme subunit 1 [Coccinella septempunctata]|uniref:SUMO-activating enzyme subunit 1 n=1 Tax=Coccinella septempunctata TaxID=41139 RepID=UPI001D06E2C1|nr:SUMO-activating enzyme subunit 1 [Coccinella septempunctata]
MSEKTLSAVEAELYDRQIRLWGIESQEKLRASNVLLINCRGLGCEIAKNILLSGINSLTILDDCIVSEEEQTRNFFLSVDSIGKKLAEAVLPKAQALNPLVKLTADTQNPSEKDVEFYKSFTIIITTAIKTDLVLKIDKICRSNNVKLISGDVFGMFGFCVADFLKHDYYEDRVQMLGKKRSHDGSEKTTVQVQGQIDYPELNKVLIFPNTKQSVDAIKKSKRRNELFFLMLVLLEFRNENSRNPEISSKLEDMQKLKIIKSSIVDLYKVSENVFDDSLFEQIFGEVVPVSAILGGVIAQEVIKAVSHKEITINNIFLLDPLTFNGKEECVGA